MRIVSKILTCACILTFVCSCTTSKDVLYFQDIEQKKDLEAFRNYEPTIKKDDMLSIVISGPNKEVIMPYNLTIGENAVGGGDPTRSTIPYHVDAEGYISFPILGKIHVDGMTRRQLETKLTEEISNDVKDPIVIISFLNHGITIMGEVHSPGHYTMPNERTTILQALSLAGDLTIAGKRSNILLLRETNGKYEYAKIDLRKSDILTSPYYFMSQNDVIYVSPISSRISSGTTPTTTISLVFSSISMIVALAVLAF